MFSLILESNLIPRMCAGRKQSVTEVTGVCSQDSYTQRSALNPSVLLRFAQKRFYSERGRRWSAPHLQVRVPQ
jgi:hypothetical protein